MTIYKSLASLPFVIRRSEERVVFDFWQLSPSQQKEAKSILAKCRTVGGRQSTLVAEAVAWVCEVTNKDETVSESEQPIHTKLDARTRSQALPKISAGGRRIIHVVELMLSLLQSPKNLKDSGSADIYEFLSQVMDYMTAADSAVMISILACGVDVLRMTMSDDAEDIVVKLCAANHVDLTADDLTRMKQRLLVARAMSIAVALRLLLNIKGTEYFTHWALMSRLTLYACLPAGFDGVANKPRGREVPAISRQIPAHPLRPYEERRLEAEWQSMLNARKTWDAEPLSITLENYISFISVHRFLQDPSEYVAACVHAGGLALKKVGAHDDEDDREEGEEVEEDDEKDMKRRTRQLEKRLGLIESHDFLIQRFREIQDLAVFYAKRLSECKEMDRETDDTILFLWQRALENPLAFVEAISVFPQILTLSAAIILTACRIHFQWPLRPGESCLLTTWATQVNRLVFKSYGSMMQSLMALLSPTELARCAAVLSLEVKELAHKMEAYPTETFVGDSQVLPGSLKRSLVAKTDAETLRRKRQRNFQLVSSGVFGKVYREEIPKIPVTILDLASERSSFCLTTPLPDNFDQLSMGRRLAQKLQDYREKIAIDNEPANAIDAEEMLLARCLNSWRVVRAAVFSGNLSHTPEAQTRPGGIRTFVYSLARLGPAEERGDLS